MGVELVSACIYCAGLLFGPLLAPPDGISAEVGIAYSTLARISAIEPEAQDISDVTPKFALIGLSGSKPAAAGLGAGTPAREWRIGAALGPSHDEQNQLIPTAEAVAPTPEAVDTTGNGRYENFALLYRLPLSARDSLEAAYTRRLFQSTDLVNVGGEAHVFSEQLVPKAERQEAGLGWRRRGPGWEVLLAGRWIKPLGSSATERYFTFSDGALWGAMVEGRLRRGPWLFLLGGEWSGGSIEVQTESSPDFVPTAREVSSSLWAVRLGAARLWKRWELSAVGYYDRSHLPFVSLAMLGTEVVAFDEGFVADSRTQEWFVDLTGRYTLAAWIRLEARLRLGWGSETVDLTDSRGIKPSRQLEVDRRGIYGADLGQWIGRPETALALVAIVTVPSGR